MKKPTEVWIVLGGDPSQDISKQYRWISKSEVKSYGPATGILHLIEKSALNEAESEIHDLRQRLKNEADSYRDLINFQKKLLASTLSDNAKLVAVLNEIANEDYRGNRSSGSVKALNALRELATEDAEEKG